MSVFASVTNMMDDLVVKATRETNTGEDWATILEICDLAGTNEGSARDCVKSLAKRFQHKNVNVTLYSLSLADSLVKNCGLVMHREISSRAFMDTLVQKVTLSSTHEVAKSRIIECVAGWVQQFGNEPGLSYAADTYQSLRAQGIAPPARKEQNVKSEMDYDRKREEEELQLALSLSLAQLDQRKEAQGRALGSESLSSRKAEPHRRSFQTAAKPLFGVRALYDFQAREDGELPLYRGDLISVWDATTYQSWWKGENRGLIGIFPSNYVEKLEDPPEQATTSFGEADVDTKRIEEFEALLQREKAYPSGRSLSDNQRLTSLYNDLVLLRPKTVGSIEEYKRKQDEMLAMQERFKQARTSYQAMLDDQLTKFQQQHASYISSHSQNYFHSSPGPYGPSQPTGPGPYNAPQNFAYVPAPNAPQTYAPYPPPPQGYPVNGQQPPPQQQQQSYSYPQQY